MRHAYYDTLLLVERVHRNFLEVVKVELERLGLRDIKNFQALILYNIGDDEMSVGEITARGFYLGTNVSYNVKLMVENGYLIQEPSPHDRRSSRVSLSDKGKAVHKQLSYFFEKHVALLPQAPITAEDLAKGNDMLRKLERFWTSMINYGGLA